MALPFAPLVARAVATCTRSLPVGVPRRRVWRQDGRAHVEAPAITDAGAQQLRDRLHDVLSQQDTVNWAEVNALTGRVAVDYEGDPGELRRLVRLISDLEGAEGGPAGATRHAPPHPADPGAGRRAMVAIAADVVGLWASLVGKAVQLTPLPVELASLVTMVDNQPRLRAMVEDRLGHEAAETVLALTSAMANGFAQGPLGLTVDLLYRASQLAEARAQERVWATRESELYANPRPKPVAPPTLADRPVPLPSGPVEAWSDRVSAGAAVAAAASLVGTRDLRRSADMLVSGIPKAARLGREAFGAQLSRSFAARGLVVLDRAMLRRLDRVDTVVVDGAALAAHTYSVVDVWAVPGHDAEQAHRRAASLLDTTDPGRETRNGHWGLQPYERVANQSLPRGAKTRARELARGRRSVLALVHGGELTALASVSQDIEPAATVLADAIRTAGHRLVVAGDRAGVARRLGADLVVARSGLATSIRDLQAGGAVVALVARKGKAALEAADVGIGLTRRRTGRPPWSADVLCGRDLRDAAYVVAATGVAAEVSRRSARLALTGSSTGALIALTGSRRRAGRRVLTAVNGAALVALLGGTWSGVTLARTPRPSLPDQTPWHALGVDDVVERLDTQRDGLPPEEAAQRLHAHGGDRSERAAIEPFLEELANPLTPVLVAGAGLSAMVGGLVDAALIGGLIGVNTLVGGFQRLHTDRAVAQLLRATAQESTVLRDGEAHVVSSDAIVPGDVVVLGSGEAVPADCRIIEADSLELDESSLTGESLPVPKSVPPRVGVPVAERSSMLYEGTTIAAGSAVAVVVATGESTESGRALAHADAAATPTVGVEERLASLTRKTLPLAAAAAAGVTGAGLLRGWAARDIAGSAVNLTVASVPEGLPFLANGAQIAAARRLAARGAIVRTPRAMEALGRVDVLCFDKTGTLTEGRIQLVCVSDGCTARSIGRLDGWQRRILGAALRASPPAEEGPADHATDEAVLAAGDQAAIGPGEGLGGWERCRDLPFEPGRGLFAGLGRTGDGMRLSVKGAPETVLDRCVAWRRAEGVVPLDDGQRALLDREVDQLARDGYRVLAVAEREASNRAVLDEERVSNLELLGFLAFADTVRSSAAEAVRALQGAGVTIVMVTGDHPGTAEAIAAELGILNGGPVITGSDLEGLDDEGLAELLEEAAVFARVTPGQKVRVVQAYQRAGHSVAMTGDGANDAPSIRLADVGVALGRASTPAARQAADLVVTDDRIETIIDAVVEGRAMWRSVRDALAILVGGNLGEIGFTVGASLVSRRPPMKARQFLLVNLLTDLAPAMAIAVQPPPDRDTQALLHEGPDRSLGDALTRDITTRAVATGAAATGAWAVARLTGTAGRAGTVALLALVGAQLGQTLGSGGGRLVTVTGLGSLGLLAAVVQTPGLSHAFGCRPVGPVGWLQAGTASVAATAAVAPRSRRQVARGR